MSFCIYPKNALNHDITISPRKQIPIRFLSYHPALSEHIMRAIARPSAPVRITGGTGGTIIIVSWKMGELSRVKWKAGLCVQSASR